ncbi:MAG: asparagine synthase-related protein [Patescibacteria group bacterium]
MEEKEITARDLVFPKAMNDFINSQIRAIREAVGPNGEAINALSGGVDSAVVTMLGHRALGSRLMTYFIDTGLMREGEGEQVVKIFRDLGVRVEIIYAERIFLKALARLTDPEKKRNRGVTQPFYQNVFARLIRESGAKVLLHGTNLTDVDETAAGIKRQHNIFKQIGIDPQAAFGYKIVEPLVRLRKDGVRMVAGALGLPKEVINRQPFPGPGLAARIIGEVTKRKLKIVKAATAIVEEHLDPLKPFQTMTILHEDRVTGAVAGKRRFGNQIEIRCWESVDARTAKPMKISWDILFELGKIIPEKIPEVVSVTYHITPKPPSTMEVI